MHGFSLEIIYKDMLDDVRLDNSTKIECYAELPANRTVFSSVFVQFDVLTALKLSQWAFYCPTA